LNPSGGKVALCALQEAVKQVFDIVGFYSILSISDSTDAALKSLA
jgi:anti-anti-sigma regulatory factor